jgi:hypothetical protein
MAVTPPAGKGAIRVMVREGQALWASAPVEACVSARVARPRRIHEVIVVSRGRPSRIIDRSFV